MHIHHLDCGCMCPLGGALYDGFSTGLRAHLVCHCLLLETAHDGLVLVDTGFGLRDMRQRGARLSAFFRRLNNIRYDTSLTAVAQVRRLSYQPDDVRHIVLTHLDFDHAGGLEDFPRATVHLMERELKSAEASTGFFGRRRFVPEQWKRVKRWQIYREQGEQWNGFNAVRTLRGLENEPLCLLPLAGHTLGHAGVAVQGPNGWLLHAGDAYFHSAEVRHAQRHCPPGLRFYQWMMDTDGSARRRNQQRLRHLSLSRPDIELFCSHDALELQRLKQPA